MNESIVNTNTGHKVKSTSIRDRDQIVTRTSIDEEIYQTEVAIESSEELEAWYNAEMVGEMVDAGMIRRGVSARWEAAANAEYPIPSTWSADQAVWDCG